MIHFLYCWPETLDYTLIWTNFLTLPPSPVFENSPYRQLILLNDAYSRWSTGNRGRATSASEVIEVAGSNHAIGVILNLAWGLFLSSYLLGPLNIFQWYGFGTCILLSPPSSSFLFLEIRCNIYLYIFFSVLMLFHFSYYFNFLLVVAI